MRFAHVAFFPVSSTSREKSGIYSRNSTTNAGEAVWVASGPTPNLNRGATKNRVDHAVSRIAMQLVGSDGIEPAPGFR